MDQAILASAIVGIINFITILYPKFDSRGRVLLALAIGIGLQYFSFDLHPILKGLELAAASSGVYKVAQVVAKR